MTVAKFFRQFLRQQKLRLGDGEEQWTGQMTLPKRRQATCKNTNGRCVCVCVCVCVEGRSPTHLPWRRGTRCRCEPRQLINDRTLRRRLHSNQLDVDVVGAGVARLSWKRQSPTPPPGLPSLATIHCANPSRCRRLFFFIHSFVHSFIHCLLAEVHWGNLSWENMLTGGLRGNQKATALIHCLA